MDPVETETSVAAQATAAQLRKLNLEITRLERELYSRWYISVSALTPLISVMIGVLGFLFGVYQFQSQGRAQQNRLLAEQQRSDITAQIDQQLQLQARIRNDVEVLLRFFTDGTQSVAGASFRFDALKAQLAIAKSIARPDTHILLISERMITNSLIRAVEDDGDFTRYRDASFAVTLIDAWPDYSAYLRSNPAHLNYIVLQYCLAVQQLRGKDKKAFLNVRFGPGDYFAWTGETGLLTATDVALFFELLRGFERCLKLVATPEDKQGYVEQFTEGIGGAEFTRRLLPN